MSIKRRKREFRKAALAYLCSRGGVRARVKDRKITNMLDELIDRRRPGTVMLYLPMGMEVDVRPLIRRLRRRGVTVLVPFMEGESFRLVKYRLPLQKKRFGIYEPKFSKQYRPKVIDIAIVPIVGTDPTGRRVGFGKGMYDRFFEKEKHNIREILFVQRHLCYSPHVVTDRYDIQADVLIGGRGSAFVGDFPHCR